MAIERIQAFNDRKIRVRYSIGSSDSTDSLKHIEAIFSRVQTRLPNCTFDLRTKESGLWKYNMRQNGKKIGAVIVQYAKSDYLYYDLVFFWDETPLLNFNFAQI